MSTAPTATAVKAAAPGRSVARAGAAPRRDAARTNRSPRSPDSRVLGGDERPARVPAARRDGRGRRARSARRVRRAAAGARPAHGGVLDWWYDGGTRRCALDLEDARDHAAFADPARHRCDVLIETERPGRLASLGLGHDARRAQPVSCTSRSRRSARPGPRAHWQASDLVASALGGVLAVSGTPDGPLNGWGRQSFNIGGFYAAIAALVGLRLAGWPATGARRPAAVRDQLHRAGATCTGSSRRCSRSVSRSAGRAALDARVYDVVPCATGRDGDAGAARGQALQVDGRGRHARRPHQEPAEDRAGAARAQRGDHGGDPRVGRDQARVGDLRRRTTPPPADGGDVQKACARRRRGRSSRRAASCVRWTSTARVHVPGPPFRLQDAPAAPAAPPPTDADAVAALLAAWPPRHPAAPRTRRRARRATSKPLAGLRVIDFTWVLAGSKATRVLGDLGADVVKLQTEVLARHGATQRLPVLRDVEPQQAQRDARHGSRALEIVRRLVGRRTS